MKSPSGDLIFFQVGCVLLIMTKKGGGPRLLYLFIYIEAASEVI